MTRCDWDSWVAAKGGRICFEPPHGRRSYPRFSRTRYSMGQNNYQVTMDPVLPVPDNLGPFEYTLPIYVRRFDMALLRIKASQTFELQELEWDERDEFYRKVDLDRVTFESDIFIIIPDPR